jgi:hypothetical protein
MKAIYFYSNYLNLVINPLQPTGMERIHTMIVNAISIIFEHFSKSHHWFQMAFISELAPFFQGFLNLGTTFPLPEFFQEILEKVNCGQILVQLQQSLKLWSFLKKQMVKVFQEQVFASLHHLFSFLSGFLKFLPSYPINDFSKGFHQMELVKDHHRFGAICPDRFDRGVPGINGNGLNRIFLLLTQRIKDSFHGFTCSLLPNKDDLASLSVENDGQIVMVFLDCHFIHCQKAGIPSCTWGKLGLKIPFMNDFHRFPTHVKVSGYVFDGHHRTEKKNILSQPLSDPFPGMNKVQFFNSIATPGASSRSISHRQSGLGIKTIEISYHPFMIRMGPFHFLLTVVTHWATPFIWVNSQVSFFFLDYRTFSLPSLIKNQKMD